MLPLQGSAPSDTRMAPRSSFRFMRSRAASQRQPVATTPAHPLAKDSESAHPLEDSESAESADRRAEAI